MTFALKISKDEAHWALSPKDFAVMHYAACPRRPRKPLTDLFSLLVCLATTHMLTCYTDIYVYCRDVCRERRLLCGRR
jgi:hypothetical protein